MKFAELSLCGSVMFLFPVLYSWQMTNNEWHWWGFETTQVETQTQGLAMVKTTQIGKSTQQQHAYIVPCFKKCWTENWNQSNDAFHCHETWRLQINQFTHHDMRIQLSTFCPCTHARLPIVPYPPNQSKTRIAKVLWLISILILIVNEMDKINLKSWETV